MGQAAGVLQDEIQTVVIDNGSHTIKSGIIGDERPRSFLSTTAGHPYGDKVQTFVGQDVQAQRDMLDIVYPIEKGIVSHWDEMEKLWYHIVHQELSIKPEEHPIFLTESLFAPTEQRVKMLQIMCETFQFPGVYLHTTPALALIAVGKRSGCVIDSGFGTTQIAPVNAGVVIRDHVRQLDIAGKELTFFGMHLLQQEGITFPSSYQAGVAHTESVKEHVCYLAMDYDVETTKCTQSPSEIAQSYTLPDNTVVTVTNARYRIPELFFRPSLAGHSPGNVLPTLIHQAIASVAGADKKTQAVMYNNLLCIGGSTLFPQFADRLKQDLSLAYTHPPSNVSSIKVNAPANRGWLAWTGGVMMTSMSSFVERWMTIPEYDEEGAERLLARKCPLQ
jgi:actin-related protein